MIMKYLRIYKILKTVKAYGLAELLPQNALSKKLKYGLFCLFWVTKVHRNKPIGERLRIALQELGPIWVKFGQMLSTRRDLFSVDIANELILLQDQVAPFDGELAKQIIESALGTSIETDFSDFDIKPLASASIAQVHTAKLKRTGADVVIKVIRPNIIPQIRADLDLMYWAAEQLENRYQDMKRLRFQEVIHDYEMTIFNELNLLQEAENTKRLRDNFINSDILYIPYVYRELCRQNVMVSERIYGVPIANIEALKQHNVNLKLLAEYGVQAFFTQVFRDNFFHADMHPGNIFIDISDPLKPRYIGIDCAIVGELSAEDQRYLAENFIAFFNRDYRKIAELYISSCWVDKSVDVFALENAMKTVCEPIFAKPLGEISFAQILFNLFNVARRFNMEIQPQLVLLEKTLFYIEGLGRQLYPQLDLWSTAKPFLETWYQERFSIKHIAQQVKTALPAWRELFPILPEKIKQYEQDNRYLRQEITQLTQQMAKINRRQKALCVIGCTITIFIAAMFIVLY